MIVNVVDIEKLAGAHTGYEVEIITEGQCSVLVHTKGSYMQQFVCFIGGRRSQKPRFSRQHALVWPPHEVLIRSLRSNHTP